MADAIFKYWGKARPNDSGGPAWHPLVYHCLDVAAVADVIFRANVGLRQALVKMLGLEENIVRAWLLFFTALHDLGKFAESFQGIQPEVFRELNLRTPGKHYTMRHDSLGLLLWDESLSELARKENWLGLPEANDHARRWEWSEGFGYWICAVTGHHGKPPSKTDRTGGNALLQHHFGSQDVEVAAVFCRRIARLFLADIQVGEVDAKVLRANIKRTSWLLAGLGVLCDWIGSDSGRGKFEYCDPGKELPQYWKEVALVRARQAVETTGILPSPVNRHTGIRVLFPDIAQPSPLQQHVSDCALATSQQLYVIEDITGSGKTEAALTLAHRLMANGQADGLFVALPTMATANAMYERLAEAYLRLFENGTRPSLVLAHGARHLSDAFRKSVMKSMMDVAQERDMSYADDEQSAGTMCSAWIADSRKKALLADIGVGTVDQALLSILYSRHQSLRLLGLCRKVLIVDEVHAYDSYMSALLQTLLKFHAALGGSAILLSATLPKKMRADLVNAYREGIGKDPVVLTDDRGYPLLTHLDTDFETPSETPLPTREDMRGRRVDVTLLHDAADAERVLIEAARRGECACWVRNTVTDALDAYRKLKPVLGENLILFHARFAMGDRIDIENAVRERFGKPKDGQQRTPERAGWVLVATQVVEQSLDLDFDAMVSDLAPIDLLIQRAGRLHRHARDKAGNLLPQGEKDQRGTACLHVFTPKPAADPSADWFKALLPKASYVYPNHGQLWLTARMLESKRGWQLPEDARDLIEGVFGEQAEDVPEGLITRTLRVEGEDSASRALASSNALKLEIGYKTTPTAWVGEALTPTRLGEVSTSVRLAHWDGKALRLWRDKDEFAWDMSQLNVRVSLISAEAEENDPALRAAIESLKQRLPDQGKWSVLLVLSKNEAGMWVSRAKDAKANEVTLTYSSERGLIKNGKGEERGV